MKQDRPFPFYRLEFNKELGEGESINVFFEYFIDLSQSNHINSNWLEFNVTNPNEAINWAYVNYLETKNYIFLPQFGIEEDN